MLLSLPLPNSSELDLLEKNEKEGFESMQKSLLQFPLYQEYLSKKIASSAKAAPNNNTHAQPLNRPEYGFLEKARTHITKLMHERLQRISDETRIPLWQERSAAKAMIRDHDQLMNFLAEQLDTAPLELCSFTPNLCSFDDIWEAIVGAGTSVAGLRGLSITSGSGAEADSGGSAIVHENWTSALKCKSLFRYPLARSNESVLSAMTSFSQPSVTFFNNGNIMDSTKGFPAKPDAASSSCENDEMKECEAILLSGNREMLLEFVSRLGCPPALRCRIWRKLIPNNEKLFFQLDENQTQLVQRSLACIQSNLFLTDLIMRMDVKNIANEDGFFVFEDLVNYILLLWARDQEIPSLTQAKYETPGKVLLPFDRLYLYVLPLCYIESDVPTLYATFRDMYCR